jgi:hypothetical protein
MSIFKMHPRIAPWVLDPFDARDNTSRTYSDYRPISFADSAMSRKIFNSREIFKHTINRQAISTAKRYP